MPLKFARAIHGPDQVLRSLVVAANLTLQALPLGAAVGAAALTLAGCQTKSAKNHEAKPSETYTVQGVVKMLPPAAQPGNNKTIVVLHQAIPGFKDREGQVVGMMPMPMPFTLGRDVDMTGIAVGSKIEFTFGIFWSEPSPTRILSLKKLPDGTQIKFSEEGE